MLMVLELSDEAETLCFSVMAKKRTLPIAVGSINCRTGKLTEGSVPTPGDVPVDTLDDGLIQHVGYTQEQLGYEK